MGSFSHKSLLRWRNCHRQGGRMAGYASLFNALFKWRSLGLCHGEKMCHVKMECFFSLKINKTSAKTFFAPKRFSIFVSMFLAIIVCELLIYIYKHIEATAFLLITKTFCTDHLTYINTHTIHYEEIIYSGSSATPAPLIVCSASIVWTCVDNLATD